jgi:ribosomal protein L11 methyltransferase
MAKIGRPYYQLQVTIPQEFEEAVSNFLVEAGSSGVKIDQNHASCKIQGCYEGDDLKSTLKRTSTYLESLEKLFPERFRFQLSSKKQKSRDWARSWRESFRPVVLGKKIAIVPAWDKGNFSERLVIRIYPQMAFGTGTHPTTQACLSALHDLVRPGDRVLDLGTGSGILAIAAAKMGARPVVAVDTDPEVA